MYRKLEPEAYKTSRRFSNKLSEHDVNSVTTGSQTNFDVHQASYWNTTKSVFGSSHLQATEFEHLSQESTYTDDLLEEAAGLMLRSVLNLLEPAARSYKKRYP